LAGVKKLSHGVPLARAPRARERAHVRPTPPVVARRDEREPELVFEDARRRVGQDVQRAPERDADGAVVGTGLRSIGHPCSSSSASAPSVAGQPSTARALDAAVPRLRA
jgi:hypothetical protein